MNTDAKTIAPTSGADSVGTLLKQLVHYISLHPDCISDATWHELDELVYCLDANPHKTAAADPVRNNTGRGKKGQPPLPDDFDSRFPEPIGGKLREWLAYKAERRDFYSPTGLRNLLSQVDSRAKEYAVESIVELITECMANNWRGIIWERIEQRGVRARQRHNTRLKGGGASPWDGFSFD